MPKLGEIKRDDGSLYAYAWYCPGCKTSHLVPTTPTHPGGPIWTFNGDQEKPTFSPSILVYPSEISPRCHSHIVNGKIRYETDCTHEFSGQTVELENWDESKL